MYVYTHTLTEICMMFQHMQVPGRPKIAEGRKLHRILKVDSIAHETLVRVDDLDKLLDGAANQVSRMWCSVTEVSHMWCSVTAASTTSTRCSTAPPTRCLVCGVV